MEWQAFLDALVVARIDLGFRAQTFALFGALMLQQVAFSTAVPHDLARSGDLEPLGHCLAGFLCSGASHTVFPITKGAHYRMLNP